LRSSFVDLHHQVATAAGPATLTARAVEQPDTPACALRVEYGGRVLGYSGDTAWSDGLLDLARGADLMVAEAYFFDRQVPFHLDHQTLAGQRERFDCKRLVITHMSPDMLARQAESAFDCAHDGMVLTL